MLPFNRSWIHQLDRGRVTVRRSSGTITPYLVAQRCRTVLKGGTYGLFCRPKVPCDTQRRHLRLILSPKGAVRHSKAALTAYSVAQRCLRYSKATLTAYSVAQRCRAVLKGDTYGLFCRPKVPCGTQRRHLRPILSPKGAVRHSKATLTAYSVAQRCRTVLKGGTYGDFSSPESTATNYPVSRTRRSAHETTLADSFVSRTRRLAHETTSEDHSVSRTRRLAHETTSADPSVSRTRLFTHETTSELSCATGTLRALLNAAEVRPEPVRLIERLGAFRDGDLDG